MAEVPIMWVHPQARSTLAPQALALVSPEDAAAVLPLRWTVCKDGYAHTHSLGGSFPAKLHLLVWAHASGTLPPFLLPSGAPGVVDHINRNRLDNRRSNLRLVTPIENSWNRGLPSPTSNIRGPLKDGSFTVSLVRHGQRVTHRGIPSLADAQAIRDSYMARSEGSSAPAAEQQQQQSGGSSSQGQAEGRGAV